MKLISFCLYLFLQREPKQITENKAKQNKKQKTTKANTSMLEKRRRIVGKGAKQWITANCCIKLKIDVICLRLYSFVLRSLGDFGGGEESFQKIACRHMNL